MSSSFSLVRRNLVKGAGALGAAALFGGLARPAIAQTSKSILQIGTPVGINDIGEAAAMALGYYKDAGLDIEISPGSFNNDGIAAVATGAAQFGKFSSSPALMLARSSGMPIKCIAAGLQKHPFAFFSTKRRPISKATDFLDAKIATQPTSRPLINALIHVNGLDASRITVENMAFDLNQLIVGQVDAATTWATNVSAFKPLGDDVVQLLLWDLGVQLYANVYYVSDDLLQKDSGLIRAFITATARGWEYTYNHPTEAVDLLVDANPNLDRDQHKEIVPLELEFAFNESTRTGGWGVMDPATWSAQLQLYSDIGEFRENPVPELSAVMTTEILDATASERPKI